ncbi:MAG: RNA-binding protein [Acidobacteria bacterium]|nr:RNA-binding protein [Acidobacteriota bacterium]
MSMTLYVANLDFQITNDELQHLFAANGTVESASVVTDRETGRSRGFGFVQMASRDEGQAAISELNGKDYQGRNLIVNEARPRENRGDNRGGYSSNRSSRW